MWRSQFTIVWLFCNYFVICVNLFENCQLSQHDNIIIYD